jgi:DNA repair protein RAD50
MHSSFEEEQLLMEKNISDSELLIANLQKKKSRLLEQNSSIQHQLGQVSGLRDQIFRAKTERDNALRKIAKDYKITKAESMFPSAGSFMSDDQVTAVLQIVEDSGEKVSQKFSQLKSEILEENEALKANHAKLCQDLALEQAALEALQAQEKAFVSSEKELMSKLQETADSEKLLSALESSRTGLLTEVASLRDQLGLPSDLDISGCIRNVEERILQAETSYRQKIEEQRSLYQEQARRARLTAAQDQSRALLLAYETARDDLQATFACSVGLSPQKFLELSVNAAQDESAKSEHLRKQLASSIEALSALEGEKKLLVRNINKLKAEKDMHSLSLQREEIRAQLSQTPDLSIRVQELADDIHRVDGEKAILDAETKLFGKFVVHAEAEHCCPLCEQVLPDVDIFVTSIQNRLTQIPEKLNQLDVTTQERSHLLRILQSVLPDWSTVTRLQDDIPELENQLVDLELNLNLLGENRALASSAWEASLVSVTRATNIREAASKLCDLYVNYQTAAAAADELELQLGPGVTVDSQHLAEVIEASEVLKSSLTSCLSKFRQFQSRLSELESAAVSVASKDQNVFLTQNRLQDVRNELAKLRGTLMERGAILRESHLRSESSSHEMSSKLRLNQERLEKNQARIDAFRQDISALRVSIHTNSHLLAVGDLSAEKNLLHQQQSVRAELEAAEIELTSASARRERLSRDLANRDLVKRNLEENMQYRVLQHELKQQERQLVRKQEVAGAPSRGDYKNQLDDLQKKIEIASAQIHQLVGARKTYDESIRARQRDLADVKHKDVDEEYRRMIVKLRTLEGLCKDLDAYYRALDKALMKYHTSKMDEINKNITDLWESTYKGGDIDSIQIKAEVEEPNDPLKSKRRQYKYRVVMVKGPTELDMRGRCSAGQKVLASLIIRLALAESFCINCGILALDEPTTNLDRDNVDSLALALGSIIEARKAGNFQLVVITHDEDFVRALGRGQHTDFYWRVRKGTLQLTSESLRDLIPLFDRPTGPLLR